jgi:hypothetical protein
MQIGSSHLPRLSLQRVLAACGHDPVRALAFAWLILLTALCAVSSFKGAAPIDARTGRPVTAVDAVLEFPIAGSLIEPLSSIAHVIAGAPDYRVAGASIACWVFLCAAALYFWTARRRASRQRAGTRALKSLAAGLASTLLFAVYLLFAVIVPLPSWSLVVREPATIIADLHSHTLGSHDGLVSPATNLAFHRARGYDLVAFTDHLSRNEQARAFLPSHGNGQSPEAMQGVEISARLADGQKSYFLVFGEVSDALFSYHDSQLADDAALRGFVDFTHQYGAVIALSFRLRPENVEQLARAGVDGFEIANFGHPSLSGKMRAVLINAQDRHGVALVSNTDWHGWSGFAKTWTVIKNIDPAKSRAGQVIQALRTRNPDSVVPIVSQRMGEPGFLRSGFAPFVEIIRYGSELSAARLCSWWAWTLLVIWAAGRLRRRQIDFPRYFACILLLIMGGGLLLGAIELLTAWHSGAPYRFPLHVGLLSAGAGLLAWSMAGLIALDAVRARKLEMNAPLPVQA